MFGTAITAFADTAVSSYSEIYYDDNLESTDDEEQREKLENKAKCNVIVKSYQTPTIVGNGTCIYNDDNTYIYEYKNMLSANKALSYYQSLKNVEWAELDGVTTGQSMSYGNPMVQGDECRDYITNNNINTENVTVAVLDTGANFTASYLHGRVRDSGVNLSDSGTENSAKSDNAHGSNIAGIIVDNTPENINIVAYKVLNKYKQGTNSSISTGIKTAVEDGADIINLSSSSTTESEMMKEAIEYAYSNGVIVVCSAGNNNDDVSKYYPAAYNEVFTVGSVDENGNRSFFSNWGEEIDFVAPGHNIQLGTGSKKDYGTSFSTPFVTAATAMALSTSPDSSPQQIKEKLIRSCVPYEELSYYDGFHAVEQYDYSDHSGIQPDRYFSDGVTPNKEELYYGYGMPQIVSLVSKIDSAIDKPIFSLPTGTYHEKKTLEITVPDGYKVYYTTDESYPSSQNGTLYSAPISIENTISVRAVAYSQDGRRSLPVACEYKMEYYADENDFSINADGYITGYNGKLTEIIVPEKINGTTVKGIDEYAFSGDKKIIGIVLPDTAVSVGEGAFESSIVKYVTGHGLTRLDCYALECESLVYLDVPNIEYIDEQALATTCLRNLDFPKLTYAGQMAFALNNSLTAVNMPLLKIIPVSAFQECHTLQTVVLNSATEIDRAAFAYCYWLKTLTAPNLVKLSNTDYLNYKTFLWCINLTEIKFPSVEYVAAGCFSNCVNLRIVDLPNAEYIGGSAFYCCQALNNINLPKVEIISPHAFSFTLDLKELNLSSAKEIGENAFRNSGIETLNAPQLKNLGGYAFCAYNEMSSTYIVNPDFKNLYAPKLVSIDDYAFAYTSELKALNLPSVTSIGENAFFESKVNYLYAPKLKETKSLPIADSSTAVLSSAFTECELNSKGYELTIYGTPNTFTETYANKNELKFVALPLLVTEPTAEYTDIKSELSVEVLGFNMTYQWFGSNVPDNESGVVIEGATSPSYKPSDNKAYPYYYCIINTSDGGYSKQLQTIFVANKASPADFTEYNKAVIKANTIERSLYRDLTVLDAALAVDVRGKNITEQHIVDEQTAAILAAIDKLKYKEADMTKLNESLKAVPDDLSVYTDESVSRLNLLLNKTKQYVGADITKQEEINSLANEILYAVDILQKKPISPTTSTQTTETSANTTNHSEKPSETNKDTQTQTTVRYNDSISPNTGAENKEITVFGGASIISLFVILLFVFDKKKQKTNTDN